MPTAYVEKLAKEHHMSLSEAESKWKEAEKKAREEGREKNYAYITSIFKSMMGETSGSQAKGKK